MCRRAGRSRRRSWRRAVVLRPERLSEAATPPKARAAAASKTSGSKSASACWMCAWRAMRSCSPFAMSGPTESSASVTAVISGSSGRSVASASHPRRMTVEVSRMSRTDSFGSSVLTGLCQAARRYWLARRPDPRGQPAPAAYHRGRGKLRRWKCPQLGYGPAGARDGDLLAFCSTVDDVATVVAQLADAHLSHGYTLTRNPSVLRLYRPHIPQPVDPCERREQPPHPIAIRPARIAPSRIWVWRTKRDPRELTVETERVGAVAHATSLSDLVQLRPSDQVR